MLELDLITLVNASQVAGLREGVQCTLNWLLVGALHVSRQYPLEVEIAEINTGGGVITIPSWTRKK